MTLRMSLLLQFARSYRMIPWICRQKPLRNTDTYIHSTSHHTTEDWLFISTSVRTLNVALSHTPRVLPSWKTALPTNVSAAVIFKSGKIEILCLIGTITAISFSRSFLSHPVTTRAADLCMLALRSNKSTDCYNKPSHRCSLYCDRHWCNIIK